MIRVGDKVRPRPEWREDPNRVPSGRVCAIVPWGDCGVIYVEGDHRAFVAQVFEIDEEENRDHRENNATAARNGLAFTG